MKNLVLLIFSLLILCRCNPVKTGFNALNNNKQEKAAQKFFKGINQDSISIPAYYGLADVYADTAFNRFNPDSSYLFHQKAVNHFNKSDSLRRHELQNQFSLDSSAFLHQNQRIDSLLYKQASKQDSIKAYQNYLDRFSNPLFKEIAVERRNKLAFDKASDQHTYEAYKIFIEKYPDAAQTEKAQKRYQRLLFQAKTGEGNLKSYQDFLKNNPQSPYHKEAKKAILYLMTRDNQLSSYARFLNQYPDSHFTFRALQYFYINFIQQNRPEQFFKLHKSFPYLDSLRKIHHAYHNVQFPVFRDGYYQIFNADGSQWAEASFKGLPENYCNGINEFLIQGFKQRNAQEKWISVYNAAGRRLARLPQQIKSGKPNHPSWAINMGLGLYKYKVGEQVGVIHVSGHHLINAYKPGEGVDSAFLLNRAKKINKGDHPDAYRYLAFLNNGKWGIKSLQGYTIIRPAYDEIRTAEDFLLLRKSQQWHITTRQQILQESSFPIKEPLSLSDFSLLDAGHLKTTINNKTGLLNNRLSWSVPLDSQEIFRLYNPLNPGPLFMVRKQAGFFPGDERHFTLYKDGKIARYEVDDYNKNDHWLALNVPSGYELWRFQDANNIIDSCKSLKLFGKSMAAYSQIGWEEKTCLLTSETKICRNISPAKALNQLKVLQSPNSSSEYKFHEYIWWNNKESGQLLKPTGEIIWQGEANEIRYLGDKYFYIKTEDDVFLLDTLGNTISLNNYEHVGDVQERVIPLLKDSKFGFFSIADRKIIQPEFDAIPQSIGHYSPQNVTTSPEQPRFWKAEKNGKLGIINADGKTLLPFNYNKVKYWHDSLVWTTKGDIWHLHNLGKAIETKDNEKTVVNPFNANIHRLKYLYNDQEHVIAKVYASTDYERGYSIIDSREGALTEPVFNEIIVLGSKETIQSGNHLYLAIKRIKEADVSVLLYMNAKGKKMARFVVNESDLEKMICD